ncbi:MAG: restriction endonuclease subunit S [Nanoarchaeota archaeon]|nr:restriction endonuclease subunit S [Nanoarchaeota archaeon]
MKQKNKTLPESWKEVELGSVAKFVNGRAFKPEEWETEGKIIIRIQDLTGSIEKPNYTTQEFDRKYLVKKGDLLISWSATLDAFIWDKEDGWLNQHIFKVEEDKDLLDHKYLFYFVKRSIELFKRNIHGSTMKHITKKDFDKIKIPLPPLPVQKKIVSILERAEKLKQQRAEADKLTQEYLQSVFYEMFMGKDFEVGKLSNFVDDFIVPQRDKPKVFDGNIPWCRIEDFNGMYLSGSKSGQYVSEETVEKMNLRVYPVGTVIVSCSADLGKSAIIKKPLVTNQTFIGLVPSSRLNSLFLYFYMNNMAKKLNQMATGATITYLSKKKFQELIVKVPPIELQRKFAGIVEKVEAMKEQQKKSKLEIDNLFNSLMQRAFKGELVR